MRGRGQHEQIFDFSRTPSQRAQSMNHAFAVYGLAAIVHAEHFAPESNGTICFADQLAKVEPQHGMVQPFVSRTRIRDRSAHHKTGRKHLASPH